MIRLPRLFIALAALLVLAVPGQAFETRAGSAYVLDYATGTVLLNKNADVPLPPASMSKLMTLYITFEAIRDGHLLLSDELPVSAHAMSYGGSTMFLDTTDRVKVEDLIRGIIVLSGNDACAVIAEALSPDGTEAGFARFMTKRAHQMGMTNSGFRNSNGWPAPGHLMSMRDLALLARHLIDDFPEYYPLFSETEFEFDGRAPLNTRNRNPLLRLGIGADGLKTGHTKAAGYGLVGSAVQKGRRVIFVISGLQSAQARAEEAESIVSWAFRHFVQKDVVTAGQRLAEAEVWMGSSRTVGLTVAEDLNTLIPIMARQGLKGDIVYSGPVHAPITKGDVLGKLIFSPDGLPEMEVELVASEDVERGGFFTRMQSVTQQLLLRLQQGPEGAL